MSLSPASGAHDPRYRPRVIPVLLVRNGGLCKGIRFRNEAYVGDPINAIRIFNEKEVDEIVVLDVDATVQGRRPPLEDIRDWASECFMPMCYGGGIGSMEDIEAILRSGVEKVCLGTAAMERSVLVAEAAKAFGSQSVVVCIDVRRSWWRGEHAVVRRGRGAIPGTIRDHVRRLRDLGAGEIILQSVDRDGTMGGYDLDLIRRVCAEVDVPVVALGGAGCVADLRSAIAAGASAAAAGSAFVFQGRHRAVLITYPGQEELATITPMEGNA